MDADGSFLGPRAREEGPLADIALASKAQCAPFELGMSFVQCGAIANFEPAEPEKSAYDGQEKFGVEEHAMYDFRDYGLD